MTTLEIINLIEADKKADHKAPTHALISEVKGKLFPIHGIFTKQIMTSEIEELVKQKKIYLGDTINDKYIKVL